MPKIFCLICVLFISTTAFTQPSQQLELLDVFDLEYVSNPQIAPNGKQIIYQRNFKDVMTDQNLSNLWLVDFDGSNNRPLTTGNHNDYGAVWSPDGKKVVYLSNAHDDKTKLYLMWLDTRQQVALTNTSQAPAQVAWSKDSQQLVFTLFTPKHQPSIIDMPAKPKGAKWNQAPIYIEDMTYRADGRGYLKGGHRQIYTLSVQGGTPRQWTFSPYDKQSPVWSADQQSVFFTANMHENHEFEPLNAEIHRLQLNTGEVTALTSRFGPDSAAQLSPDGKQLAYLGFDDTFQGHTIRELYVMDVDGNNSKLVSADLDRSVQSMAWAGDSKSLFIQYTDRGEGKLAQLQLNGKYKNVAGQLGGLALGRPYNAAAFSVSNNNRLAFTLGTPAHPADLAVASKGKTQRLTALNDDIFAHKKLGQVKELWWQSSVDQRDIQGWVVTPPDFDPSKKYPFILEIHGGPFASYGSVFSAEAQLFAAAGYVVLYSNPRGSTGYGQEFANLIHHDYPNNDYHDLMSGVDAVLAEGYVDEDQLFVTGGSGGGVLTAWIIGKTDRFKAAVVAKPVINWTSFVLYADNPGFFYKYWFASKPWEDPESYHKRSPLSYVGNIKTPTMLLTGEEDFRTPIAESEQFYAALKLQRVDAAMVRIPGSGHGIANKPSNLVAKVASILAWFKRYQTTTE